MKKLFDLKQHDLIIFTTKLNGPDHLFECVVSSVSPREEYDLVGIRGFAFVHVTDTEVNGECGTLNVKEVFRRDGDIYKKVY